MKELRVSSHGKVLKYFSFAKCQLQQHLSIRITALGIAIPKAIATGELLKAQLEHLQQIVTTTLTNGVSTIVISLSLDSFHDTRNQNPGCSNQGNHRKKRHANTKSRHNSATTKAEHKQWRRVPSPACSVVHAPDAVPDAVVFVIDSVFGSSLSESTDMDHDCKGKMLDSTMFDTTRGESHQNKRGLDCLEVTETLRKRRLTVKERLLRCSKRCKLRWTNYLRPLGMTTKKLCVGVSKGSSAPPMGLIVVHPVLEE
ncbi:OLC1v1029496C1 [Oldenlandia corymbosa var. corymbosa]|uniref:OLC1v1029496C1 n=1 Tax=Oldenlandia corymbosa var. corymbosa TaxID=529605 RepID=A0AAV1CEA4_OLDCO|nr:OLC1v1029496C1 [Oldenlandia corymbosa var. corymbosa]